MAVFGFGGLSLKEKMFFARHMAVMSRSGMQIIDILNALKKQNKSRSYQKMMTRIIADIKNGSTLHGALERYNKVFGNFFINVVKIGEVSGTLVENLDYLAVSLEKQKEIQSKAQGAIAYPIIIMIATLGITGLLTFVIFPKILPVFRGLKVDLPLTTRIFIKVATFATEQTITMAIIIGAMIVGAFFLLRFRAVKYARDMALLYIPIMGVMVRNYNVVFFMRTLSMLLKSSTRIVEALSITSETMTNLVYKKSLVVIAKKVARGESVSQNLKKYPRLFPAILVQMMSVGEQTGTLDTTGEYLSDFYDKELDASTKAVTNIIEPLLLMLMGGIVGFIALAIIQPIYAVSQGF